MMMNDFGFILDTAPVRGATHSLLWKVFFFLQIDFGVKNGNYGREAGQALKTQKKHKNTPRTPPRGEKKKGKRRGTCLWT